LSRYENTIKLLQLHQQILGRYLDRQSTTTTTITMTDPSPQGLSEVDVNTVASPAKKAKTNSTTNDSAVAVYDVIKILTFSMGTSPKQFQVLSCHTLSDLVNIAFEVCDPANGEDAWSHMWYIKVNDRKYESGDFPCVSELRASNCRLQDLSLAPDTVLSLCYDYGRSMYWTFKVDAVEEAGSTAFQKSDYPRAKPMPPPPTITFSTDQVDLDTKYPALNGFLQGSNNIEFNLFQVGNRRNNYGFMKKWVDITTEEMEMSVEKMVFLPDKPKSLAHLLTCMDRGANIPTDGSSNSDWHSIVVLTSNKKHRYDQDTGVCDCEVVAPPDGSSAEEKLETIFPKVAALAGFTKKNPKVSPGWITYENGVLRVVQGKGSPPKRPDTDTAYAGWGVHQPSKDDTILFRVDKTIGSLQELFCTVESLL
jgi:hypothetical protein